MVNPKGKLDKNHTRCVRYALLVALMLVFHSVPAQAQTPRDFSPVARGELYEQQFLDDFFDALGYRPTGLTWVDESETLRLLVTAGVQGRRGDADDALRTLDLLPDIIAVAFPFLATMREDLLVPKILEPWHDFEAARTTLFTFYRDVWLPHPEYRDDYISFRDDTRGRASRRDPEVPAVWLLGHLSDFGFVPDQALSEDDPYLFLWDLLTSVTYYSQRCTFYGLQYDRYNPADYKQAVVRRVGEVIKTAHDEASRREMGRSFWGSLIDSYHPFETPTEGVESTGEMTLEPEPDATSRDEPEGFDIPYEGATSVATERDHEESAEPEPTDEEYADEIEALIEALEQRLEDTDEEPSEEAAPSEDTSRAEDLIPVEPPEEEIPDEFTATDVITSTDVAEEEGPPEDMGNYAAMRLNELADELAVHVGDLAADLGQETMDLVMLYDDANVSEETIVNAEDRYIAKREAFLAGLGIWDRFDMEIYTPLTLADFNDLVLADLRSPYEELKGRPPQWAMYQDLEDDFEEAFGQIADGITNRRNEPDIMAAEAAALTAFLGEYNDLIKEIEDMVAGASAEPVEEE